MMYTNYIFMLQSHMLSRVHLHQLHSSTRRFNQVETSDSGPLTIHIYNADSSSLYVNAVLVKGKQQSILFNTGLTVADSYRIAANILDTGTKLKSIVVLNSNPEFLMAAAVLKMTFPACEFLTTLAIREKLLAQANSWHSGYQTVTGLNRFSELSLPEIMRGNIFILDGELLHLIGTTGPFSHRPYVWLPSCQAILGSSSVQGNLHIWLSDAHKPNERQEWVNQLKQMLGLKPKVVIPGYMSPNCPLDVNNIHFTMDYLNNFERELVHAKNANQVVTAMRHLYPQLKLKTALDISAKIALGEMTW